MLNSLNGNDADLTKNKKKNMSNQSDTITLRDVTFYWASLLNPNPTSGSRQVNVCNLSKTQVAELKKIGIVPRDATKLENKDDEMGHFFTARVAFEPSVYDAKGHKLPETPNNVGNGSKGAIKVHQYVNPSYPENPSNRFTSIQITDLVEYVSEDSFEEAEGSFVAAPAEF